MPAKKEITLATLRNDLQATEQRLDKRIVATKERLDAMEQCLDQKIDVVDCKIDKVAIELVKTQADVLEIKETMATKLATKDDLSHIQATIDSFAGKLEIYSHETAILPKPLDEHGKILRNHENRLGA